VSVVLLRQVRLFRDAARAGNLARAAEAHLLAPSAVGEYVKRLESHVGLALLERTSRGVRLTHDGTQLLAEAERLLEASDDLGSVVRAVRAGDAGEVRVAFPDGCVALAVAAMLPHSGAVVSTPVPAGWDEDAGSLLPDRADLALAWHPGDGGLGSVPLGLHRRMAVLSVDDPAPGLGDVTADALSEHVFVTAGPSGPVDAWGPHPLAASERLPVHGLREAHFELRTAGRVALLPEPLAVQAPRRLVVRPFLDAAPARLYLLSHAETKNPAARQIVEQHRAVAERRGDRRSRAAAGPVRRDL
jgi:DNA-binding transcriptional LysR family regulator